MLIAGLALSVIHPVRSWQGKIVKAGLHARTDSCVSVIYKQTHRCGAAGVWQAKGQGQEVLSEPGTSWCVHWAAPEVRLPQPWASSQHSQQLGPKTATPRQNSCTQY